PQDRVVQQAAGPFNLPTAVAVTESGDMFVSDGYGNSRIHKFDPDGNHIKSWGESGTDPGQFSLPHNVSMLGTDRIVVADRENFRLQVFTTDGEFVKQIHLHHPMSVTEGKGDDRAIYVGEMIPPPVQQGVPNLGAMIAVLSPEGEFLQHLGGPLPGEGVDQFTAPHGITTDSQGTVYAAEVAWTNYFSNPENSGSEELPLGEVVSLRKWRRT
ncbi:MAG TPA: peptidylglycine alpha-amidating monooxygenase, partial [Dehalococcoidia bacterium]|nr:peptidylglycine alpha-amidating monooxygenase [Dehalococcoidia bacterium]